MAHSMVAAHPYPVNPHCPLRRRDPNGGGSETIRRRGLAISLVDRAVRSQASRHRRYVRTETVPPRPKIFDEVRAEMDKLLRSNPAMNTVEPLNTVRGKYPQRFDNVSWVRC